MSMFPRTGLLKINSPLKEWELPDLSSNTTSPVLGSAFQEFYDKTERIEICMHSKVSQTLNLRQDSVIKTYSKLLERELRQVLTNHLNIKLWNQKYV